MFPSLTPSADKKQLLDIQICQREIVKIDVDIKNRINEIRQISNVSQKDLASICKEAKDRLNEMAKKVDNLESIASRVRVFKRQYWGGIQFSHVTHEFIRKPFPWR